MAYFLISSDKGKKFDKDLRIVPGVEERRQQQKGDKSAHKKE